MIAQQRKIQHLFWRAGFGLTPQELNQWQGNKLSTLIDELFKESHKALPLSVVNLPKIASVNRKKMTAEERKAFRKERQEQSKNLNRAWLDRMVSGKGRLREKMTLFWHGHFACKTPLPYLSQMQNNTLREHALGKFGDLLLAVSKDPAMLQFLNNQQNRKQQPNENFARELLELFTLGRGNYTEKDIQEAARAFTGWGFNREGQFVFRERVHDFGSKTFMGKTGNFNGEDIIKIVLENPQTAQYITTKLYKFLVNEEPDTQRVKELADFFYQADYDITKLLQKIFNANWFYDEQNVGVLIKSPVVLLVSTRRNFGITFQNKDIQLFIQRVLGQMVFNPPNVAGWAGGKYWIDSSTLLFRLQFTNYIFLQSDVRVNDKDEGDVNVENFRKTGGRKLKATVAWEPYLKRFSKEKNRKKLLAELEQYLLQSNAAVSTEEFLKKWQNEETGNFVKQVTLALTALPDYQLA